MHQELSRFAAQWLRVAAIALLPVIATAFVTIPWNLGGHPGERASVAAAGDRHMT
jgi:hypothetical protein